MYYKYKKLLKIDYIFNFLHNNYMHLISQIWFSYLAHLFTCGSNVAPLYNGIRMIRGMYKPSHITA